MKLTSAHYLFPLLFSVGLPLACSGSTDKAVKPEGKDYDAAGAAGEGSGGSKSPDPGSTGGGGDVAGTGPIAGTGGAAGAGPVGEAGSAGQSPLDGGGAGGEGGSDSGVTEPKPAIDPSLDGADDSASGSYRLHYRNSPNCLASHQSEAGKEVFSEACSEAADQEFYLDGAGAGSVRVRGVTSKVCVHLVGVDVGPVVCNEDAGLTLQHIGFGFFQLKVTADLCIGMNGDTPSQVKCTTDTAWSLDALGTNYAINAKWSATSTFPGYSTDYAHDGDIHAGLSGHSWTNNWQPPGLVLPQEVNIDLGALRQFSSINVFTSQGYEIGSYDIDYWNGKEWANLETVSGNNSGVIRHLFPTVVAQKLRFVVRRGPEAQYIYARLNEVQIF